MKRIFSLVIAVCMIFSLSACGAGAESTTATVTQVDYDLTEMSGDMVYALVYQMLISPEDYLGKTVRISGLYYASYYSVTEAYYHYCIIADATSCCSQGMEFIWGSGEHSYPDEYPENYTQVVIVGTFGCYQELDYLYYCLLDASLEEVDT